MCGHKHVITCVSRHRLIFMSSFSFYFSWYLSARFLLMGGQKGHLASIDWNSKKLGCEFHVQETVRDVK